MIRNALYQLHRLAGISLGLVLAVMGATGALVALDDDVTAWLDAGAGPARVMQVPPDDRPPLSPDALLAAFRAQMPDARPSLLTLSGHPGGSARIAFQVGPAASYRGLPADKRYLDPYTGRILGQARGERFFAGLLLLHRVLLLPGGSEGWGRQITGAASLALLLFILSGLYLRWPRRPGGWRAWLKPDLHLRGRGLYRSLHVTLGVWMIPVYLVSALTGAAFAFEGWNRAATWMLTGTLPPAKAERSKSPAAGPGEQVPPPLDAAWAGLRAAMTDGADRILITLPAPGDDQVRMRYLDRDFPHDRAFNEVLLDARTGAVRRLIRFDSLPPGRQMVSALVAVHRGTMFGGVGKVLFLLSAACLPLFAVTGWLMYLGRWRSRADARRHAAQVRTADADGAILVAHASQTGTAEQWAWRAAASLQQGGRPVRVVPLAGVAAADLMAAEQMLVVASTYGAGEPPDAARTFARRMMAQPLSLPGLRYGVLALGDSGHADFCAFGHAVDRWLSDSGATPSFPMVRMDGRADAQAQAVWNGHLASLGGAAGAEPEPLAHQPWRLTRRTLLNPGGPGGEIWHVVLEPPLGVVAEWSPGDIAEIVPEPPPGQPLRGQPTRDFSIASLADGGRLELLVRRKVLPDGGLGLGSGWLTRYAPPGGIVRLRVRTNHGFHPPATPVPMILIGAGTGLAGLRAHLLHRAAHGVAGAWLLFGERSSRTDRLLADEIRDWMERRVLSRCDLTFSRDPVEGAPRYVQDRLVEMAVDVRRWVEGGAVLYVCGGQAMGAAVHQALTGILGLDSVDVLAAEGRYRRDVY